MAKNSASAARRVSLLSLMAWALRPGTRWATLSALAALLAVGGWFVVWRQVRPRVLASDDYRVELDDVAMTPAPPWIVGDVRRQALERGGVEFPLDLLDDGVLQRVSAAVELHPWVARVVEVRKLHPARIDVTVEYRRPVAMIEVQGGLYPVDSLGVLLPSDDFSPESAARFPRVGGFETAPLGPPGSAWGDPRVVSAAALGAALVDDWPAWRLERITPLRAAAPDASSIEFQITTVGGSIVVWGHPPGAEGPAEASGADKLQRLRALAARPHGIDGDAASLIDLRGPAESTQRTADRPAEGSAAVRQ